MMQYLSLSLHELKLQIWTFWLIYCRMTSKPSYSNKLHNNYESEIDESKATITLPLLIKIDNNNVLWFHQDNFIVGIDFNLLAALEKH